MLAGVDQVVGLGDLPDLRFAQTAQGKQRVCQLLLSQHVQKIGLVLAAVRGPFQKIPAAGGILLHPGIMPGGQIVAAQRSSPLEQRPEFDGAVTFRAGVRRAPCLIFLYKVPDDRVPEHLGEIEHIEGKAQTPGHQGGILRIGQRAAGPLPTLAQVFIVEHPQIHAGELIALLQKQHGGDRAVHPAAHCDTCPHIHPPFLGSIIPRDGAKAIKKEKPRQATAFVSPDFPEERPWRAGRLPEPAGPG